MQALIAEQSPSIISYRFSSRVRTSNQHNRYAQTAAVGLYICRTALGTQNSVQQLDCSHTEP